MTPRQKALALGSPTLLLLLGSLAWNLGELVIERVKARTF